MSLNKLFVLSAHPILNLFICTEEKMPGVLLVLGSLSLKLSVSRELFAFDSYGHCVLVMDTNTNEIHT